MRSFSSQLLCTFSTFKNYQKEILNLSEFYKIDGDRIYVLTNAENLEEIFLTYNAEIDSTIDRYYPNTISVHRKKDFNILYSINALNALVKNENRGSYSLDYKIDWPKYKNSLVVINDGKLKITSTKLLTIFFLK
jgi:hypothetical protein